MVEVYFAVLDRALMVLVGEHSIRVSLGGT